MSALSKLAKDELFARITEEMKRPYIFPLHMDLTTLVALIGNVQVALRHPKNTGPTAAIARDVISKVREKLITDGFPAHADLIRLGDEAEAD